ncbi:MAG: TetR/AcrR family transcriptional regulator [Chthoniobacter sp.]
MLEKAIEVFAAHGYEGTSTEELLEVMGISRQSMYNAFGDKRRLYLQALQRYTVASVSDQIRVLAAPSSALKGIRALLDFAVSKSVADSDPTCLGISAICEFGRSDPEITMVFEMAGRTFQAALERRMTEAREKGETGRETDPQIAAQFIQATLTGIKIAARAGATEQHLRGIARLALRGLQ